MIFPFFNSFILYVFWELKSFSVFPALKLFGNPRQPNDNTQLQIQFFETPATSLLKSH